MKLSLSVATAVLWVMLGACPGSPPAVLLAAEVTVLQTGGVAICEYSSRDEILVFEYDVTFSELANSDPVPRLQVFGSGRVRVHYPRFMKKSGDYELWLSDQDLNALVESAADEVLEFDESGVRALKQEAVLQGQYQARTEDRGGVLTYSAGGDATHIGIFLDRYVPADRSLPERHNLDKRISWRDLAFDAREHPHIAPIKRLAAFAEELSALTEHPGLERLAE